MGYLDAQRGAASEIEKEGSEEVLYLLLVPGQELLEGATY